MPAAPDATKPDADAMVLRLRDVRTSLRSDLQISRQLTKGKPVYVLFDPISYQAHRLTHADYRVLACLGRGRTTAESFDACVHQGLLDPEEEVDFYLFVVNLETLGLLSSSRQDPSVLFKKFQLKQQAASKSKLTEILFLTIPLSNPDKFLDRTQHLFRPLFWKAALWIWLALFAAALMLLATMWREFWEPWNSLLATQNLLFLGIAFVTLKVWHELGHGYACKVFGGRVPEMGCKLIVGMPLAYVDASSAWSFPNRMHRIMVMLGGMYFESLVAIPAIFVWASTPDSFLGSCAFQLIFMAGAATVLFNANPLMKFDGYFILSDLLGIPNLRTKSIREFHQMLQRNILGMDGTSQASGSERILLLAFGIASSTYMVFITVSIMALIAIRFQMLGLLLAGYKLGSMLFQSSKKLFHFLLQSDATSAVRPRARTVAATLAFGVPTLLLLFPIPVSIPVSGIVSAEQSTIIRADTPGIIRGLVERQNQLVKQGEPLALLENIDASMEQDVELWKAREEWQKVRLVGLNDVADAARAQPLALAQNEKARLALDRAKKLTIRAPHAGRLVFLLPQYAQGAYANTGEPIAKVVQGKTIVRAYLNEDQITHAKLSKGSKVRVRFLDHSLAPCLGEVESVSAAKTEEFEDLALTTLSSGDIPIDPETELAIHPVFLIQVTLPESSSDQVRQDMRAELLFGRQYESIGALGYRSTRKFVHSVFASP